jgi:glycosyltransferase involved in cell wall biosynthesis
MDLVSVIIPVFNAEKTIADTIKSVLSQSYENFEIIIVDDGSIDNSKNEIFKFNDNRIIYKFQENQGSPVAKNTGIKMAKGEYVQFLDADDLLSQDKILEQILVLENNPDCVAICDTYIFEKFEDIPSGNLGGPIDKSFVFTTSDTFNFVLNLNGINGQVGMIQPNAFLTPISVIKKAGPWSTLLARSPDDDSEFFLRVILNSKGIKYVEKGRNYYRRTSSSTLSQGKSIENINGAYLTIKLKYEEIFKIRKDKETINLYFLNLLSFLYTYYSFYTITYPIVMNEMKLYGIKKLPLRGGVKFITSVKLFGVLNTLRLLHFFKT